MLDNSPLSEDGSDSTELDPEFDPEHRGAGETPHSPAGYPWMRVGAHTLALAGFAVLAIGPTLPQPSLTFC